jgi:O-antigen ligase
MTPANELVIPREIARSRRLPWDLDTRAVSAWVLSLSLVLYLAIDGGGYALATHSQVGIAVWWVVVLAAAWGLLPAASLTRSAKATFGLFAAFTAWTALGITWSISSGRSFQDLALVTCYLGIIVLAVAIHRERGEALRHTTAAIATAIVIVAVLALASRLWPNLFPASHQTAQFLGGARQRLSWPLNYWNALAALMAVGVPLLLAQATSARTLLMQSLATAAIPLVALCDALTLSRGGVIEGVIAVIVFIALAPDRIPKLATAAVAAAGSAIVVYGGLHRHAIQQGLTNAAERHQASSLVVAVVVTCIGVGVIQLGVGLLNRHATLPRFLTVSPARARLLTIAGVVLIVVVAIAAGAPHRLDHAWNDFKNPHSAISATSTSRFGSSSGEGRYQYWVAGVDSAKSHVLTGSGPGTFQLDWLPRAPIASYVENAHSLYVETYTELGLVGLVLLVAFLVAALVAVVRVVIRSGYEERTRAAAIAAALVAFLIGAAFDWLWQMPVLPAAMLLLLGAALAPASEASAPKPRRAGLPTQLTAVAVGLACLVAIAYPLATNSAVANSQGEASIGNLPLALTDAQSAVKLEPGSAEAQVQLALVYEADRQYALGVAASQHAVKDEPQNWSNWFVLFRLQAEDGDAHASLVSYLKAKSLNPQSSVFRES